jgi:hypothetical protein
MTDMISIGDTQDARRRVPTVHRWAAAGGKLTAWSRRRRMARPRAEVDRLLMEGEATTA